MSDGISIVPHHSPSKPSKKKKKKRIWIFLLFAILLIAIVFPLVKNVSLTGFSVSSGDSSGNSSDSSQVEKIFVSADLGIPALEVRGDFDEVILKGNSLGSLNVGNQEVSLNNDVDPGITLLEFRGKLHFNESGVYFLEGKADRVLMNGVPIESQSDRDLKVSLDGPFYYESLSVSGLIVYKIKYKTSGSVNLDEGRTILNFEDEIVSIKDFSGDFNIEENRFKLAGTLTSFETQGTQDIRIGI